MKNRWSKRKAFDLEIGVFSNGNELASASVRDISLGGVSLGMEQATQPVANQDVELVFKSDDPVVANHALHAIVLDADKSGIRCKFKDIGTMDFLVLKKVLASDHTPGPI